MSKAKLIGLGVALAALAATPSFAQTSPSPSTTRPSTSAPSGAPSTTRAVMPSDIKAMKASEVIGKNVYSSTEERIGEIDDIVVSKSGGSPMAVIGVGGFLGIGEKKAAVPIDQLKVQGDKIVAAGLTKDSLKAQAEYKSAEYDKYDRNRTVGEAASGATGGSSSTGSSSPMGSGSSTSPSGSTGMGAPTGSYSTSPSGAPSNAPPTGSGASGSGSSSGTPTETPKQ
jgi:sporulation protein YlmC with PRC-barrel domain